jgi:hypothetical protein
LAQAKAFAVARLQPEEDAATDIQTVFREYVVWCKAAGTNRLPVEEITAALDSLFAIEKSGNSYVLTGITVKKLARPELAQLHV